MNKIINSKLIEISDSNFKNIIKGEKFFLLYFWANWCNSCKSVLPIIKDLSIKYYNKIYIYKINIEFNKILVKKYNIITIPTLILLRNDILLYKISGLITKKIIKKKINFFIKK